MDDFSEKIARDIINVAVNVHKAIGPGLLESAYKECMYYELIHNGLKVEKEKQIPLFYKEISLDCGYRADLVVENRVLLELKSIEELTKIHLAQMLTYLKIGEYRLGFLINFNVMLLKNGIQRVIL